MFHFFFKRSRKIKDVKLYATTDGALERRFDKYEYVHELLREIEQRDDVIKQLRQELDARKEDVIIHNNFELLDSVNHIVRIPEKTLMYYDKLPGSKNTIILVETKFSDGSKRKDKLFEYKENEQNL